jgi:phospholipid/cholesterol/gamma-HCH transport system permease protein
MMSKASIQVRKLQAQTLEILIAGEWLLGEETPLSQEVANEIKSGIERVMFNVKELFSWDSSLLTFLLDVTGMCRSRRIRVEMEGLPNGVRQLINLATAVPKKEDARKSVSRDPFLAKVGSEFMAFIGSAGELVSFVGDASSSLLRLFTGRAKVRASDLAMFLQETGAQAVPIVSLISFLVGLILAFVGVMQLQMFGAQIYVADLVGIAMVREMAAIMTGIIMAGRTGAAYAAQLGTMQVNEEIDALETLGVSPMDFLVLPRMLALTLMMPLLALYANLMGLLGGMVVAVGLYDVSLVEYISRTQEAIRLDDYFVGLFMSLVFGVLVTLSGCMRGMQCGRSASAVGDATTSAVVTGIVSIIIATAAITVVCAVLGI